MPILGRLAEQAGEPEAFQDALEPLFADSRGKQPNGLGVVDREANLAGALNQNVSETRSTHFVMTQGRNRVARKIGGQIRIRYRLGTGIAFNASLDSATDQLTFPLRFHPEHEHRVHKLLAR